MQRIEQKQNHARLRSDAQIAIILANQIPWSSLFEPALARVGTLPVLLRAILGVQATRPERIIVVFNRVTGPQIRRDLLETHRLPSRLEWFEVAVGTPLSSIVRQVISDSGRTRVVLVSGDRTYRPDLHRVVKEWDRRRSILELTTGGNPIGLFAFSHEAALDLASDSCSSLETLYDLHRWIMRKAIAKGPGFVEFRLAEQDSWQKISMPQDVTVAEQKLDRWLVKPTDGIFARMNRRISIPISRQLVKYPITPNMVSGFTLGVSFAAGALYAFGGYWNVLFGAVLSVAASILDGCDGEVARLKLQASDFGCWLETACDYLYYLFIFAGMTIGLVRSSGRLAFGAWGGALLFGAVVTILLAWFERSRLSGNHPEQFLAVWQKKAESRSSNPLLYIGRHCEFIIRRCFLPYALLVFALLNLNWLALYMSAIGANIAWIISLYSKISFSSQSWAAAETHTSREMKPIHGRG
jgi:phosphatidylglycerophosphate synthase